MKNKKTLFIVGGIVLAVILAVVIIVCSFGGKKTDSPQNTSEPETETTATSDLKIDDPETEAGSETETTLDETSAMPDDGNALTLEDEPMPTKTGKTGTGGKAGQTATPVTEKTPTDDGNVGGITIGGGQTEKYDCGTPGHHCDGPETHAYILNLELEGCPYCHKSNCPSFYAVDQWGNTCYTPSKCPQYDVHKDPVYYCQTCGKPTGDGSHGTCVQFVTACNCPDCGKWVEAWTCHTH